MVFPTVILLYDLFLFISIIIYLIVKLIKKENKTPDAVSEIFNWCIDGLKNFYIKKAIPPSSLINNALEYKYSNDVLEHFINQRLVPVKILL